MTATPRTYSRRKTTEQKLELIFNTIINDAHWSFANLLYHAFRMNTEEGIKISRSKQHASIVSRFLGGRDCHTPATIVKLWYDHPGGCPTSDEERKLMHSPTIPFVNMKPARSALSSFAVQMTCKYLIKEQTRALKPETSSGLAMTKAKEDVSWRILGKSTTADIKKKLQTYQPVLWHYPHHLVACIMAKKWSGNIGHLNFCTNRARIMAVGRAILYFACGAQQTLFDYNSQVGNTMAYSSTQLTLKKLSKKKAREIWALGTDPKHWPVLRLDNVQCYHKQQEQRMGWTDQIIVGTASMANNTMPIPSGTKWFPPGDVFPSAETQATTRQSKAKKTKKKSQCQPKDKANEADLDESTQEQFEGDHTLTESMHFMSDALVAHEFAYAVTTGDIRRAYECFKMMPYKIWDIPIGDDMFVGI
ncbi:hypothetical protein SERLADRAFT_412187 [Serpula lacrymans var. lacrymans S7.9]|uniref:DUF6589 domain-containing protein n=1 Tax=Serpula lacrymans var. lacrymans (strain S7.9) TaxID=578457 RepID=F8PE91_SERL9|nr:uncharacterized protein SERLADRAFT_412187 [Serpula lacrymans var. lacrymans S7.9]EGO18688.1 hypothetical protein SERLADRAFT_412187 [Serpula lacrymans var. lacrymans S7.9]